MPVGPSNEKPGFIKSYVSPPALKVCSLKTKRNEKTVMTKNFIFLKLYNLLPYSAATISLLNELLEIPMGIGFIFSILPKIGSINKKKAK